jgi:hypothetical protein
MSSSSFKVGRNGLRNNVQLSRFGRNRSNVSQYPGLNSFARCGEEGNLLTLHRTVKPVAMVADAILDCSARGDIALDAFLGSGTTVIAAERTDRRGRNSVRPISTRSSAAGTQGPVEAPFMPWVGAELFHADKSALYSRGRIEPFPGRLFVGLPQAPVAQPSFSSGYALLRSAVIWSS